jgi:hypothetical protein
MRAEIPQYNKQQLLFAQKTEIPLWQELHESTRREALRHLAQLFRPVPETVTTGPVLSSGGQDE